MLRIDDLVYKNPAVIHQKMQYQGDNTHLEWVEKLQMVLFLAGGKLNGSHQVDKDNN